MLSGLFKRKDKKSKASEDEIEEIEKSSGESSRSSPQPKTSSESLSQESRSSKPQGPQRQSSKLQKQPPAEISALVKEQQEEHTAQESPNNGEDWQSPTKDFGSSVRQVVSPQGDDVPQPLRLRSPEVTREAVASPPSERSKASTDSSSPVKVNSPTDFQVRQTENASRQDTQSRSVMSPPLQFQQKTVMDNQEALSESPVNVSPLDARGQMGLMGDASPQDERPVSPLSPPSSSPELVDEGDPKRDDGTPASTPSSSANTPTWSDASLRSYLDDENDIRDLLIIVHDKSNVPPAGPDHPITGSLFKEESKRLKEMTSQLDEMLANWISRKLESASPK